MKGVYIIAGAIFVICLIAIGVLIYYIYDNVSNSSDSEPDPTSTDSGQFLSPCSAQISCDQGLTCDTSTLTCKKSQGQTCQSASDCVIGTTCNDNTCDSSQSSIVTGLPGDICPCPDNMVCVSNQICLLNDSESCTSNEDCASNICSEDTGVCSETYDVGFDCTSDNQCTSANCSSGICQPAGIDDGSAGAYCDTQHPCYPDSYSLTCLNSVCVSASAYLNSACNTDGTSSNMTCLPYLTCESSICVYPNFHDPNKICVPLYTTSIGICKSPDGFPCSNSQYCSSTSSCDLSGTRSLGIYYFTDSSGNNISTYPISTSNVIRYANLNIDSESVAIPSVINNIRYYTASYNTGANGNYPFYVVISASDGVYLGYFYISGLDISTNSLSLGLSKLCNDVDVVDACMIVSIFVSGYYICKNSDSTYTVKYLNTNGTVLSDVYPTGSINRMSFVHNAYSTNNQYIVFYFLDDSTGAILYSVYDSLTGEASAITNYFLSFVPHFNIFGTINEPYPGYFNIIGFAEDATSLEYDPQTPSYTSPIPASISQSYYSSSSPSITSLYTDSSIFDTTTYSNVFVTVVNHTDVYLSLLDGNMNDMYSTYIPIDFSDETDIIAANPNSGLILVSRLGKCQ